VWGLHDNRPRLNSPLRRHYTKGRATAPIWTNPFLWTDKSSCQIVYGPDSSLDQVGRIGELSIFYTWCTGRLAASFVGGRKDRVSAPALRDFERLDGGSDPRQGTVHKWQRALEATGVRSKMQMIMMPRRQAQGREGETVKEESEWPAD
jgi:hypothetical protein